MYGGWDAALARYTEFFAARGIAPRRSQARHRSRRRLRLPSDSARAARLSRDGDRPRPQAARRARAAHATAKRSRSSARTSWSSAATRRRAGRAHRLHGRHAAAPRLARRRDAARGRRVRGARARRHVHRDVSRFHGRERKSSNASSPCAATSKTVSRAFSSSSPPRSRCTISSIGASTGAGTSRRASTASCGCRRRGSS